MLGRVVSTKMEKTAVVIVERQKKHPLYNKAFLQTKKYLVDDPFKVKDGDIVIFEKIKPISKLKHWRITKVLGADFVSLQEAALKEEAAEAIAEVLPEEEEETEAVEKTENLEAAVEVPEEKPAKAAPTSKPKKETTKKEKTEEKPKAKAKKGSK